MRNFSSIDNKPLSERTIDLVCSETGFPESVVKRIYENNASIGKTDAEIRKYFQDLNNMTIPTSSDEFLKGLDVTLPNIDKKEHSNKFISLLNEYANGSRESNVKNMDSVNILATINKVLAIKDTGIVEEILTKTGFNLLDNNINDTEKLIPNLTESLKSQTQSETLELFESLKTILYKNNNRWGYSHHLSNTHQTILEYLEREITKIQNAQNIHSVDSTFALEILRSLCSTKPNPQYFHINYVKGVVSDLQTLAFDILLIISNFVSHNKEVLKFISRNDTAEIEDVSNKLFFKLFSSLPNSKVLKKEIIANRKCVEDYINTCDPSNTMLQNFSCQLNYGENSINYRAITVMNCMQLLNLLSSMSIEFNISFRPLIKFYVTKMNNFLQVLGKKKVELVKVYANRGLEGFWSS